MSTTPPKRLFDVIRETLRLKHYSYRTEQMYGSGLRLAEALSLRVKDLDFAQSQLIIRDTKGNEDRVTPLPDAVCNSLQEHLSIVRRWHTQDLERGSGAVYLPYALSRKYPNAEREWCW